MGPLPLSKRPGCLYTLLGPLWIFQHYGEVLAYVSQNVRVRRSLEADITHPVPCQIGSSVPYSDSLMSLFCPLLLTKLQGSCFSLFDIFHVLLSPQFYAYFSFFNVQITHYSCRKKISYWCNFQYTCTDFHIARVKMCFVLFFRGSLSLGQNFCKIAGRLFIPFLSYISSAFLLLLDTTAEESWEMWGLESGGNSCSKWSRLEVEPAIASLKHMLKLLDKQCLKIRFIRTQTSPKT